MVETNRVPIFDHNKIQFFNSIKRFHRYLQNISTMVSLTASLISLAMIIGVIAVPVEGPAESTISKRSSPNSSGTNNGFYYQFCERRWHLILGLSY